MAKSGNIPRTIRIYADGVFDMFHSAHAQMLYQAKVYFGEENASRIRLIAGVSSDEDTLKYKGKTAMKEEHRYEALRHCKYVDEVLTACPWVITDDFLQQHKVIISILMLLLKYLDSFAFLTLLL